MKNKISFILAILITLCAFNLSVNAEELFKNEFTTKKDAVNGFNINAIEPPKFGMENLSLPAYAQTFASTLRDGGDQFLGNIDMIEYNLGSTTTVPVPFREGYIKIDVEDNGTNLLYLNAYGETVKTNKINNEWIISGGTIRYLLDLTKEYNGKFYCLGVNKNNNRLSTLVINENLEVEKRLENQIMLGIIDGRFYFVGDGGFSTSNASLEKFDKFDVISLIPQRIPTESEVDFLGKQVMYLLQLLPKYKWLADLCYDDVIHIVKISLPFIKAVQENLPKPTSDDPALDELESMAAELEEKIMPIFENNKIVKFVKGSDFRDLDISGSYLLIVDGDNARVMDKNGNQVANVNVDYNNSYSIQLVHDYIAVFRTLDNDTQTKIDFYDFSGNKIQTITSNENEAFIYTKENQGGFAVASADLKTMKKSRSKQTSVALFTNMLEESDESLPSFLKESSVRYTSSVYSMPQAVALNVLGSGNVTVANNARFGERVSLNVNIPEGQILKKVRVYDANGKEIVVENNTFLMPNTPVTIDAEFVPVLKENPKTGIISLTFLGIASVGLYLTYRKNKANLTKFKRI